MNALNDAFGGFAQRAGVGAPVRNGAKTIGCGMCVCGLKLRG
ncbi:hypothetical protein THIOSC15_1870001 [uncultured Thiomicrorhabdus sp.]